ncbi:hypothetical protein MNB_SV-4-1 [hydrothermal vent metagenome]|uniref:Zona occludens toxin N-terminal domain-containing protein n=1 Tax=hydrothermal vent metagenome TaxID=652676 RepID=A0A1W1EA00_9ZZZZ
MYCSILFFVLLIGVLYIIAECKRIYDSQIASLGDGSQTNVIDEPIIDYLLSIGFIELNPAYEEYQKELNHRDTLNPYFASVLNTVKPLKAQPKYKPSLFVIDEAQNHFSSVDKTTGRAASADPVLIWWIAYHRHLCMDVILLTQHYDKLHSAYLKDIEYFLEAVPASRIVGLSFKYNKYIKIPYYKTNLAETIKLKKKKEVFELYDSGDRVRSKNVVLPWIFLSLLGLVVVVLIFYYVSHYMFGGNKSKVSSNMQKKLEITKNHEIFYQKHSPAKKVKVKSFSASGLKYLRFVCIGTRCSNSMNNIVFDLTDLKSVIDSTGSRFLRQRIVNSRLQITELTVLASFDFMDLFKQEERGIKDEVLSLTN